MSPSIITRGKTSTANLRYLSRQVRTVLAGSRRRTSANTVLLIKRNRLITALYGRKKKENNRL